MDENHIIGFVYHVTKYANDNMKIGFYNKDIDSTFTYSTDTSSGGTLPQEIAHTLSGTLGCKI